MLFSERFKITRSQEDDWFDPILNADTKLFVDPFLIFQENASTGSRWGVSHDRIVAHFQGAFEQLALSECRPGHLRYTAALQALRFQEPREFCLGYTSLGTGGAGSGDGFASVIAAAMCAAIERGKRELRHFEELGVLQEGIGPDRISDMACTVLKPDFVAYTQDIAGRHSIPLDRHALPASSFDRRAFRWSRESVRLPTNPCTGGPVLLVPERFLKELPTLNADDWWNSREAAELRDRLNLAVMDRVDKKTIGSLAQHDPGVVAAWARRREASRATPYDLARDPRGVYVWDAEARRFAAANPVVLAPPVSEEDFQEVIQLVVDRFRHFVENERGWDLLWNGPEPKPEEAAQLLFRGIARSYCEANNINIDREVMLGRGPVDFKFSNGYRHRALLEVKKLENGKFWNGLWAQLPAYLTDDDCDHGWLLAIRYQHTGVAPVRARTLGREVAAAAKEHNVQLRCGMVDARRPTSASNLKRASGL